MPRLVKRLVWDESGQDLTEYTLLIALMSLLVVGLVGNLDPIMAIWQTGNSTIAQANTSAS